MNVFYQKSLSHESKIHSYIKDLDCVFIYIYSTYVSVIVSRQFLV